MEFSIKLARAAALMTWVSILVGCIAATVMDAVGPPEGVVIHLWASYAWTAYGVVCAGFMTALPVLAMR